MTEVGTRDCVTFKAFSLSLQAPGVFDLPWPQNVSCCHVDCGVWRVLSPGKQSSGPGAAGSCGAESRLDTTKTRKHNETDWLAAGSAGRESAECRQHRPPPTVCPGRLSVRAGRGLTQDRGHQGCGVLPGRARWPWDLGFGLMVLLCVLGTGPASPGSTLNRHFLTGSQLIPAMRGGTYETS